MSQEITSNRKAFFNYQILEKFEAGIVLVGSEVKAIRAHNINLKGGYIVERKGELFLEHVHISPYSHAGESEVLPERSRKLLLQKKEIAQIIKALDTKGHTVIPLAVFLKNHKVKISLAIAHGKTNIDKRKTIQEREEKRKVGAVLKRYARS